MLNLNLHAGGELIDFDALRDVPTPEPTKTHHPLPHYQLVDMVRYSLGYYGHEIEDEAHAIDKDGLRYFGVLSLRSPEGDYAHSVGLRNSADKTFPIGISFGSVVFVCSNLAFNGEKVIKRRHTPKAKRDLPALVAEAIEPLHQARLAMSQQYDRFKAKELGDYEADAAVMQMYREGVINVQRVANVVDAWDNPPHDWGGRSVWRLFNATTYALTGRVAEDPRTTQKLHEILEGECTRLH